MIGYQRFDDDGKFDGWNPPKEVLRRIRLANNQLRKICEIYSDYENHKRYCGQCPLNYDGSKCAYGIVRFWA